MAIAFRSSTHTGNDQTVSALSVAVPAATIAKDLVVCILSRWETFAHPPVTTPPGFLPFGNEIASGDGNGKLLFYYKRLTEPDTGTYEFSWGTPMSSHIHTLCFVGAIASGDPVGLNFKSLSSMTSYPLSLGITVPFAPALVWTTFHTIATNSGIPSGLYTETADSLNGCTAYYVPGVSGSYSLTNAGGTPQSASCAAFFAIEPIPFTYWTAVGDAASGAEGDLGYAGYGARFVASTADANSADGDLTVSGSHVLFSGAGSAATDATADLSVVPYAALTLLDGYAETATDAAGTLGPTRWLTPIGFAVTADATADLTVGIGPPPIALDGVVHACGDASGNLGTGFALGGSADVATVGTGELGAQRALGGSADAATATTGELDGTSSPVEVPLDGAVLIVAGTSGELGAERPCEGAAGVATDATAALTAEVGLDGAADAAMSADGALGVSAAAVVELVGAVAMFGDATADLVIILPVLLDGAADTADAADGALGVTVRFGAVVVELVAVFAELTIIPPGRGQLTSPMRNGTSITALARLASVITVGNTYP